MYSFFAYLNRMKYINRWSLMRNTRYENLMEHSFIVAQVAHAIALIANEKFGKNVDADKIGMFAIYHETSEVITGDLPTPIKYYNMEINKAYKDIEKKSNDKILSKLPDELIIPFDKYINIDKDSYEGKIVKAADRIAAYIKCIEEASQGNSEFRQAATQIKDKINENILPEVKYFMDNFIPSYSLTLDELD